MKNTAYELEAKYLRNKAEASLKKKPTRKTPLSEIDTLKLIHELEVHQIELEMQNEELVLAKEELAKAADKKYQELYDLAPAGYFRLSREGEITELNLCGSRMLGRERGQIKNSRIGFFIAEDSRPAFNLFLENVFTLKNIESCEVTLATDTNVPPLWVYLTGILTEDGEQCLLSMIDITERKRAIESLVENQRLGAIGAMASSVAHDFNNVLQVISGNLELATLQTDLSETTLQYLKTIKTATKDAAARVEMLRRFGGKKPETNHYFPVNLSILVSEIITQLRPLWKDEAERNGLHIAIQTKFGEVQILGNDSELRTVLYNIIKNSIEAMPGGGNILLETKEKPDGAYVTLSDTGTGMNEETRAKIFQPFYSTKGFEPGRGLGMSGVLGIVKEHGGNIYVKETTIGKGTIIEMVFPLLQHGEITEKKETTKKPSKAGNVARILWVEDDIGIAEMVNELIIALGHKGDIANGGKEALEYLEKNTYDIVITDIGMPHMNGWQLSDIIKEKYNGKMKIAVASGWGSDITEDEKAKHGVTYNIGKPFNISQLKQLLDGVG